MKNLSKFHIRFFGVHVDIDDFACRHGTILFPARKRRYRCVRKRTGNRIRSWVLTTGLDAYIMAMIINVAMMNTMAVVSRC